MTVEIKIYSESAGDTLKELGALAAALLPGVVTAAPVVVPAPQPETPAPAAPARRNSRRAATSPPAPEVVAETPETEAQDEADEADETEAGRDEKNPLTVEDVKVAVNAYVKKFGMPAAQEDGPKIFVEALGKPPAGEPFWKMSLLPDDQDKLRKVIETWGKAVELNPLKRAAV